MEGTAPVSSTRQKTTPGRGAGSSRSRTALVPPVAWIFRTNIPLRRGMPLPKNAQRRNFFGIGEVLSVLANPGETLKSLTEARKSLEDARREIKETKERSQLRTTHTFAPLPGFFARPAEVQAVERALSGTPSFTVLIGASSVGKTALLREVLSRDAYHVLHFDLRIAGFADLGSLYGSLSRQMETYFETLSENVEGYEDFVKEAWGFKHDRLGMEKLVEAHGPNIVKTSDIARLMELFQSSLLRYWQFDPKVPDSTETSGEVKGDDAPERAPGPSSKPIPSSPEKAGSSNKSEGDRPKKKIPVFFIDEAHKLPALIHSTETMKCLLDAMLVLTKQDRLCHVIHATSDGFYQSWLRKLNIMQHCKLISIGDCSREEMKVFFRERLLPSIPETMRNGLDFDTIYEAFGGKLVHWTDYATDYVNAGGDLPVKRSSHFIQAYTLLHLHLVNSVDSDFATVEEKPKPKRRGSSRKPSKHGFQIYSPLTAETMVNYDETRSVSDAGSSEGSNAPSFTTSQLLDIMRRLVVPLPSVNGHERAGRNRHEYIPYFPLCRELGVHAVDDMVRARILELRWMDTVTPEWEVDDANNIHITPASEDTHSDGGHAAAAASSSSPPAWHTHLQVQDSVLGSESGRPTSGVDAGPKLVPLTPIVRFAMREVLKEYEMECDYFFVDREVADTARGRAAGCKTLGSVKGDDVSDYASAASLSDVYEY